MGDMAAQMQEAVSQYAQIMTGDWVMTFLGMTLGVKSFMAALDLPGKEGLKIYHTLENLALIATGTSAGALEGGTGGAIVSAISDAANKMSGEKEITLKLDANATKEFLESGQYKWASET